MYVYTQKNGQVAVCSKQSSIPLGAIFSEVDTLPADRLFRSAWALSNDSIIEDLDESKLVAHSMRRLRRSELFKPDDAIVALQIPGQEHQQAETRRNNTRDADAIVQGDIDTVSDVDSIRQVLSDYGAI